MNCRLNIASSRRSARGFTMVEIAIALGVIGFALVAIIGILPTGLEVQRDNRSETIINQDATFWLEAIRGGAQGMDDLTNWVEKITTPEADYDFGDGGLASSKFSYGSNVVSLLTTALRFGGTNVQAIVTAFSGSAAEKDLDKTSRDLAFRYRLSVVITNAASLSRPFWDLDPENANDSQPLESMYEVRLTFRYPYVGKPSGEPRSKSYRATISRNVVTNLANGREFYLFAP